MICLKSFFCIFAIELKNGLWCNGNTTDSGSVIPSSSLGSLTFFFFWKKFGGRKKILIFATAKRDGAIAQQVRAHDS